MHSTLNDRGSIIAAVCRIVLFAGAMSACGAGDETTADAMSDVDGNGASSYDGQCNGYDSIVMPGDRLPEHGFRLA